MKKLFTLFFFIVCFFNTRAQVGCCDSLVPTFYVDFTGAAGTVWTSPPVSRNGLCCSGLGSRCIQFIITTDSNSCGFSMTHIGQQIGSYYMQLCCGSTPLNLAVPINVNPGTYSLTFCTPGNNLYNYYVTSLISCTGSPIADTLCSLNCSLITITKDDLQPKTISVYPNPANDKLSIQLPETLKGKISFQIYDVTGRAVSTQSEITNHKSEIDVSSLNAGVYFLKINEGENSVVKRFLKE